MSFFFTAIRTPNVSMAIKTISPPVVALYLFYFCCFLANTSPFNFPFDSLQLICIVGQGAEYCYCCCGSTGLFPQALPSVLFQLNQNTSVLLLVMSWPRNVLKLLPWETPNRVQAYFLLFFFLMLKLKNNPDISDPFSIPCL